MDFRHLRYLIAAVEEGSFQGASQRVHVAQPALSRRIRDLEVELGCELLVRGARGVTPTRAGEAFYRKALNILEELDEASHLARSIGSEQAKVARLGLVQTSRKFAFVQDAVAAFSSQNPNGVISLKRGASHDLAGALRDGRLDLTFLYEWRVNSHGFRERTIHKERYVLAVHPRHRLAVAEPAELADFADEPLVWLARRENTHGHDALMRQCRLHGIEPAIGHHAASYEEQFDLVLVTGGTCLTPALTMLSMPPGALVFRPLPSFEAEINLSLAWSEELGGSASALLDALQAAIDQHQANIEAGRTDWARLMGHPVVRIPSSREDATALEAIP
jgi:DNA-binding transcriptional LysR family regulator